MSPYRRKFAILRGVEPRSSGAAEKGTVYDLRMGDLHSQSPNGELSTSMSLKDVLYAPYMGLTMISNNYNAKTGCKVIFEGEERGRSANLRYHHS